MQRLANNFGMVNYSVPKFLNVVDFAHRLVGPKLLEFLSSVMNKASMNYIPEWNKYMPKVSLNTYTEPFPCVSCVTLLTRRSVLPDAHLQSPCHPNML